MKLLCKSVTGESADAAVSQLRDELDGFPVKTLIFFASYVYHEQDIAGKIKTAFPSALTFGCSSYAEFDMGHIKRHSLTVMAFGPGALELSAAAVAEGISHDHDAVDKAFAALEERLGVGMIDLDYRKHFGITLFDGTSPRIERAMERVGALSDIIFIGGYASDDFSMTKIRQYLDGQTYEDAAVLAVLKPSVEFSLLKTQSAESVGVSFTATKVDESTRTIWELDGSPAAEAYADAIDISVADVSDDLFLLYPLGLMAGGDPFVRAGRRILPGGGLQLFCNVKEGQRLFLMRTGDIVATTAKALEKKRQELGAIRSVLDFDCAHRALTLAAEKQEEEYAAVFDGMETAGFFTFGEAYIGNVNQTAVMALFGD